MSMKQELQSRVNLRQQYKDFMLNQPGWILFDEEDAEKARQLSGDLKGTGTVDELGFSPLYDEIANELFPWCSTLTTRARYFFFSLVVLRNALETVAFGEKETYDDHSLRQIARNKLSAFQSEVIKGEKIIALLLVNQDSGYSGLFGKRQLSRMYREDVQAKEFIRKKILQNNSRYPNRIYRGSCRNLSMFIGPKNEIEMIEWALTNKQIFSTEWLVVSDRIWSQFKKAKNHWDEKVQNRLILGSPISTLYDEIKNKTFKGFELNEEEAFFLKKKITQSSPFLKHLTKNEIKDLIKNPELGMKLVGQKIRKSNEEEGKRFIAAYHIDNVTSPFRKLYSSIVAKNEKETLNKMDPNQIRRSFNWLQEHCPFSEWDAGFNSRIEKWIQLLSKSYSHKELISELKNHARNTVEDRKKLAPHLITDSKSKKQKETDLSEEIDFRESSYRLWNAAQILNDIYKALP